MAAFSASVFRCTEGKSGRKKANVMDAFRLAPGDRPEKAFLSVPQLIRCPALLLLCHYDQQERTQPLATDSGRWGVGGDGGVSEAPEIKVHLAKVERDCRICHLSLEGGTQEYGVPIELGCSCKDDLAAARKQCEESWFKIKRNE